MTPESYIRESINALRNESVWSPMPEHLLFIQTKSGQKRSKQAPALNLKDGSNQLPKNESERNTETKDATTPPSLLRAETEVVNKCEICDMIFRTNAMLTYHKVAFCVGKPIDENAPIPRLLPEESTVVSDEEPAPTQCSDDDVTGDGVIPDNVGYMQQRSKRGPAWCRSKDGAVPPFSVKVAETDIDQEPTYVCMVQVGGEQLPATLHPSRKRATCSVKGQVFNVAEYDVLVDPSGQLSWQHCPVVGGIPRDAVKGGCDSANLQYYVARGKAPDGTMCCGQYIPHKQQCYFAYDDTEYTAMDFHFLCKKYSSQELAILEKSTPKTTDDAK